MTYNEISKRATNKYRSFFDIIQIRIPKGEKQRIIEHAKSYGESMNAFIYRAVSETIKRDEAKRRKKKKDTEGISNPDCDQKWPKKM